MVTRTRPRKKNGRSRPYRADVRASHPIKIGAEVAVIAVHAETGPVISGYGIIVGACFTYPHWYRIRLSGEQVTRIHFINPDWQRNPERSYELLREFLRTGGKSPFDDFWPSDDNNRR